MSLADNLAQQPFPLVWSLPVHGTSALWFWSFTPQSNNPWVRAHLIEPFSVTTLLELLGLT